MAAILHARVPARASSESRLRSSVEGVEPVRGGRGRRAPRNLLAELYRPDSSHETERRRAVSARPEGLAREPTTLADDAKAPRFGYQESPRMWEPVARPEPTTQGAAAFSGGFAPPPRLHRVPTLQTACNGSPDRAPQARFTRAEVEVFVFSGFLMFACSGV